jgi:hypothetical protein
MDIRLTIHALVPSAQYGGGVSENTRAEFESLVWEDSRPKPTWEDLVAAYPAVNQKYSALRMVESLESQITPRRIREAVLGVDGGWLARQEAAIQKARRALQCSYYTPSLPPCLTDGAVAVGHTFQPKCMVGQTTISAHKCGASCLLLA